MSLIIAIFIILLFSAFFSGMEAAFVYSDKIRLELDKKSESFPSRILNYITKSPGFYFATVFTGKSIGMAGFILSFPWVYTAAGNLFWGNLLTLLVQITVLALIFLIFADFLPKNLFRISPNRLLNIFSLPFALFFILFYTLTACLLRISKIFQSPFPKTTAYHSTKDNAFGIAELGHFVNAEAPNDNPQQGTIEQEVKLFRNALDFSRIKLREIMVPRTEIEAMDIHSEMETIRQKFIETGFSKILFYDGNIDNIVGYLHSSAMFKNPVAVQPLLIGANIVPETMPANKLLSMFIRDHRSLAVVVDEFGGTSGIVTSEDILEEIFGEIEDEHDTNDIIEKQTAPNEYILSGRSEIDSLNEKFGLRLPESDEFETLAGFILAQYKSIPKINTVIETGNFTFKILKATNTKIELVHLTVAEN